MTRSTLFGLFPSMHWNTALLAVDGNDADCLHPGPLHDKGTRRNKGLLVGQGHVLSRLDGRKRGD